THQCLRAPLARPDRKQLAQMRRASRVRIGVRMHGQATHTRSLQTIDRQGRPARPPPKNSVPNHFRGDALLDRVSRPRKGGQGQISMRVDVNETRGKDEAVAVDLPSGHRSACRSDEGYPSGADSNISNEGRSPTSVMNLSATNNEI